MWSGLTHVYPTTSKNADDTWEAKEALEEVWRARDYTCGGSNALDLGRAGRLIVKAYVDGDLLYCHAPPSVTGDELEQFRADTRSTALASASVRSKVDDAIKRAERGGRANLVDDQGDRRCGLRVSTRRTMGR